MRTRKLLTAGAAGLAGLAVAGFSAPAAVAGPTSTGTIGTCSARGDYATCVAVGTAHYPRTRTLTVTVTSSPRRTVSVSWDTVCSQGFGAGSRSGSFNARTPVTRTIPHPYQPAASVHRVGWRSASSRGEQHPRVPQGIQLSGRGGDREKKRRASSRRGDRAGAARGQRGRRRILIGGTTGSQATQHGINGGTVTAYKMAPVKLPAGMPLAGGPARSRRGKGRGTIDTTNWAGYADVPLPASQPSARPHGVHRRHFRHPSAE